ncbi:hypothetical protein HDU67_007870 [Dinochytrium kinnereticum]|nr:hypothetical protein HDU67_007870 [Dinochytrium kinnereticum]
MASAAPEILIREEPLASAVAQSLIKALNATLMDINPNPAAHSMSLSPDQTSPGLGTFLVVYAKQPNESVETPIGCGAIRKILLSDTDLSQLDAMLGNTIHPFIDETRAELHSTIAELKRMYVDPRFRGLGIGKKVVRRLEEEAGRIGVKRLLLETGPDLEAAVKVYEGCGFRRVHNYGEYAVKDPADSICYGKDL